MDAALSLKTGESLCAIRATYESQRQFILVCPECGEPVHLVERTHPRQTKYFSHPDLKIETASASCSLRVLGASFRPASQLLKGISQGQLTDRFQLKVVAELLQAFGKHADAVRFVARNIQSVEARERLIKDGRRLINQQRYTTLPSWLNSMAILSVEQRSSTDEAVSDVYMFLQSAYGGWVVAWLLVLARIIASTISPSQIHGAQPTVGVRCGRRRACFVLEQYRLNLIVEDPTQVSDLLNPKRNSIVGHLLAAITYHTIIRWRNPNRLQMTNLLLVTNLEVDTIAVTDRVERQAQTNVTSKLELANDSTSSKYSASKQININPGPATLTGSSTAGDSIGRSVGLGDALNSLGRAIGSWSAMGSDTSTGKAPPPFTASPLQLCPSCQYMARLAAPEYRHYVCWRCKTQFYATR